ncbi:MAG: hypothetical protein VXY93_13205, partial [Pseudomonadota bacterium]|nr:hypothetical protein [Pseudomonadota bacterium]
HGGAWYELVNADLTGRVGTGTESYFIDRLVSTSTTATSLNVTGVSTFTSILNANQLNFGDSNGSSTNIALFGDSNDLKIYHNGSHSIVQETGAGGLLLLGSVVEIGVPSGSEKYFRAVQNGAAELYYDSSSHSTAKLATTATGVTIDGTAVAGALDISGDIDVDGHTNLDNVSIAGVTTSSGNITISNALPTLFLTDTDHNPDWSVRNSNGIFTIYDDTNSTDRFTINGAGTANVAMHLSVGNSLSVTGNISATGDLDIDGHTNLDNVSIAGVTTAAGHILPSADVTYDLGSSSKQWRNLYADNIV